VKEKQDLVWIFARSMELEDTLETPTTKDVTGLIPELSVANHSHQEVSKWLKIH